MTTQKAPLEQLLNRLRTRKIKKYISGKNVLDFGCGQSAWTAKSLSGDCASIVGIDSSLDLDQSEVDGIALFKDFSSLQNLTFDVILMLAVIEHIRPFDFRDLLNEFLKVILVFNFFESGHRDAIVRQKFLFPDSMLRNG